MQSSSPVGVSPKSSRSGLPIALRLDIGHATRLVSPEGFGVVSKRIYVCAEDECVGPFASHEDADCFIALIELQCGSREGIEKVEFAREALNNSRESFQSHPCDGNHS